MRQVYYLSSHQTVHPRTPYLAFPTVTVGVRVLSLDPHVCLVNHLESSTDRPVS
jgi:hypothetical protein